MYASFEIELCAKYDMGGDTFIDTVENGNTQKYGPEISRFWTVYGRKPNGEVDAIADSTDEARARHIMALLEAGVRSVSKLNPDNQETTYPNAEYLKVAMARTNDGLEIDDDCAFSPSDEGCWVQAWMYVGDHEVEMP